MMMDTTFSYRGQSICLVAPDERDELSKRVRLFGTFYESDVLERCELYIRRLGRARETILDVGAFIGNHTVFFASFCQAEQVIAFEPSRSSFEALTETILCNGLNNVTAHNVAIGDQDGWGVMAISDPANLGANRVQPSIQSDADAVRIVPLDSFLESLDSRLGRISLVKIDVEGMESDVLQGAKRTIARNRPILCVEMLDAAHMEKVIRLLQGSSYLIRECDRAGPTYLLTWETRTPRVLIRAINFLWLLLARYGNNAMRWYWRRVIEIALPLRPSPPASTLDADVAASTTAKETPSETNQTRSAAVTRLNVLLAVPWDQESGGVASVVGYLARHLDAHGHRVQFLHPGPPELLRYKKTKWGFEGAELNLRSPFLPEHPLRSVVAFLVTFPFTLFQLIRFLRKHEIDVVNIHYAGPAFIYFAVCRWLLSNKLVISVHGTDVLPFDHARGAPTSPTLRLLLKTADLIVGPSRGFLRKLTSPLAPQIVIHNGIDLSEFEVSTGAGSGDGDGPFILSVATHEEWKGLDVLIRAMALLRDEGQTVRLLLAGDGPARPKLEQLAATLRLDGQIRFMGFQSRPSVARLLHGCTLFVLPSRYESFGIAIVEALACGKPVVATAVLGIPEIIENGTHGLLVEADDASALASAIRRLLGDAELRERLGRSGRRRVEDQFQWHQMGESYTHAYQELVERGA